MPALSLPRPVKIAGGNIRPSRILVMTAAKDTVIEATTHTLPLVGVSINATKYPPGSTEDTGFLATATLPDAVAYYGQGDICYVMAGAAITDFRLLLTSDSAGRATPATTALASFGSSTQNAAVYTIGYPLSAAEAAGELISIQIDLKYFPPVA